MMSFFAVIVNYLVEVFLLGYIGLVGLFGIYLFFGSWDPKKIKLSRVRSSIGAVVAIGGLFFGLWLKRFISIEIGSDVVESTFHSLGSARAWIDIWQNAVNVMFIAVVTYIPIRCVRLGIKNGWRNNIIIGVILFVLMVLMVSIMIRYGWGLRLVTA